MQSEIALPIDAASFIDFGIFKKGCAYFLAAMVFSERRVRKLPSFMGTEFAAMLFYPLIFPESLFSI